MKQRKSFGDSRQTQTCLYCGTTTETKDHIPSKVFIDEPFPDNLATNRICLTCNNKFSKDEEYAACMIECMKFGTPDINSLEREKVQRILKAKPELHGRIKNSFQKTLFEDMTRVEYEIERINGVFLKLARGHALFEMNTPLREEPKIISVFLLDDLSPNERTRFESLSIANKLPEVGSRMMIGIIENGAPYFPWNTVQKDRYRYLTAEDGGLLVKIVVSEYMACEVRWE